MLTLWPSLRFLPSHKSCKFFWCSKLSCCDCCFHKVMPSQPNILKGKFDVSREITSCCHISAPEYFHPPRQNVILFRVIFPFEIIWNAFKTTLISNRPFIESFAIFCTHQFDCTIWVYSRIRINHKSQFCKIYKFSCLKTCWKLCSFPICIYYPNQQLATSYLFVQGLGTTESHFNHGRFICRCYRSHRHLRPSYVYFILASFNE